MKRQKRVSIYKYKYISIWETDRHEARLVEGRVEAGELIHWPLSLGWLSCCHSVPWWAFDLPCPPRSLLRSPCPHPDLLLLSSFSSSNLILPLLVLWWGLLLFQPPPCQNTSTSKGHLKRRPHFKCFFFPFGKKKKKKEAPVGPYWEAAVVVVPCPGTPHPHDARLSASAASVAEIFV